MIVDAAHAEPLTHGWFNHGAQILRLVDQHQPYVCVELGTWMGASAIPVARVIRQWRGTLTCIDTWAGEVDGGVESPQPITPWMLPACARNILQAGVSGTVRLVPSTTLEAARWWNTPIDYLYVDADHRYESVLADLRAWVPHVAPGGLIVGDDYGSDMYPGVALAWDQFAHEQRITLHYYQSDPPDRHGIQLVYGTV